MPRLKRGNTMSVPMHPAIRELKFYDDTRMRPLREALEATVLAWPGVARKEMMGCLVYFRGKRFFAFLVTGGLVITKLPDADRAALVKRRGAKPFAMSGRKSSKWVQLPVAKPADLKPLLPYVRKSYDASGRLEDLAGHLSRFGPAEKWKRDLDRAREADD